MSSIPKSQDNENNTLDFATKFIKEFDRKVAFSVQCRRKATDVMLELIASAQAAGITAKYVLFDSWFSAPKTILALKREHGLDTIAMVKKSKTKYLWNVEKVNLKQI